MKRLCLLRHLPTDWNKQKRLQGRHDQPLSADSRPARTISLDKARWRLVSSPLVRCLETARLTFGTEPVPEPALIEMHWGDFEGARLKDLRRDQGEVLAINESRGLDFCPPGGESPRDVQQRLAEWLKREAATAGNLVAVSHKGVIRALYALATGWDMTSDAPERLDWNCLHCFILHPDGTPEIDKLNTQADELQ